MTWMEMNLAMKPNEWSCCKNFVGMLLFGVLVSAAMAIASA